MAICSCTQTKALHCPQDGVPASEDPVQVLLDWALAPLARLALALRYNAFSLFLRWFIRACLNSGAPPQPHNLAQLCSSLITV